MKLLFRILKVSRQASDSSSPYSLVRFGNWWRSGVSEKGRRAFGE
jgi:hypothetical protein